MKKSYIKPLIDFESFELAEFVAACNAHTGVADTGSFTLAEACAFEAHFYRVQQCSVDFFSLEAYNVFDMSWVSSGCEKGLESYVGDLPIMQTAFRS